MKSSKRYIISVLVLFLLIFFDQFTKRLAVTKLKGQSDLVIIDRVLVFSYLENTGAAFSSFAGRQTFLILLTTFVIVVLFWKYLTLPQDKRFTCIRICLLLISGGAIGNLIDRAARQYVIDYIYFVPIDFPKFNVADIYITVGVIFLGILLFFYYNDEEFETLMSIRHRSHKDDL